VRLARRQRPKARTFRPAERFLCAGAEQARRVHAGFVGTEHLLLAILEEQDGAANRLLELLGVDRAQVAAALECWLVPSPRQIDPDALASLGIDFDAVRDRLEQSFGSGALERTRSACLGVAPRAKVALAFAVDYAGQANPVTSEHILLGILSVPESLAASVLATLGVTHGTAAASASS
jgi:ATP-dependent Clp protease ATP-binding subunit ClpA